MTDLEKKQAEKIRNNEKQKRFRENMKKQGYRHAGIWVRRDEKSVTRPQIKGREECAICGSKTKLECHHSDYSKPYEVIFICKRCHAVADKLRKENECPAH